MLKSGECILYSGSAPGAEAEFGVQAEALGIEEVNFTYEGRATPRLRGIRVLSREELAKGDVSLAYVSRLLNRSYTDAPTIRKVLQTIWYQVNSGQEMYVVGSILPDGTVKGGTGWGAEFAKLCNKPVFVFDQAKNGWFTWKDDKWVPPEGGQAIRIGNTRFTGTGTRLLEENGRKAIRELFARSFA